MDFKILNKTEQPLLSRVELKAEISYEKTTPSRADIIKSIASHAKAEENVIALVKVATGFGSKKAKILAHIYKTEADKKRIETKAILTKGIKKEKKAKKAPEAKK